MPEHHRLVFVGGLHRSGTTPLTRVLSQHPLASGLTCTGVREDEGQHLQDVYPKARAHGGAGRFAFAPEAHLTERSSLVGPDTAERLLRAWEPYWDTSRPVLIEKSPPNLVMGRFLRAVFPDSVLIMVVRHPVVVALSTVKWRRLVSRQWQNHTSAERMVRHWIRAHEIMRADLDTMKRCHVVYYEDLVSKPVDELGKIQELLQLEQPFDVRGLSARHSDQYEQTWHAMSTGSPWQRRQRLLIESRHGQHIKEFGYSLQDLRSHAATGLSTTGVQPSAGK